MEKEERRGEGRDGNGWASGADPENRRIKVARALGSTKRGKLTHKIESSWHCLAK
jgi:hypothetical protein